MNLERAAMRGRLSELQDNERKLKLRIESAATTIRAGLNTILKPPAELAVPELDEQWDILKSAWAELQVVMADIARLERELK